MNFSSFSYKITPTEKMTTARSCKPTTPSKLWDTDTDVVVDVEKMTTIRSWKQTHTSVSFVC